LYYYDFKGYYGLLGLPRKIGEDNWVNKGFGVNKVYNTYMRALNSVSYDFSEAQDY